MKKTRTKIYIKTTPERNEIVYTGIEFAEFNQCLSHPIENLLLLKGGDCGNEYIHNFEILEGTEKIIKLSKEDIYNWGDFCFVDYAVRGAVAGLHTQEIAELLYIAQMATPLNTAFFTQLKNRFTYLAHDDGWFCKLYCDDLSEFIHVFLRKITTSTKLPLSNVSSTINEQLLTLAMSGILVDLEENNCKKGSTDIRIYTVGEYSNMDDILNNFEAIKAGSSKITYLESHNGEYILSQD